MVFLSDALEGDPCYESPGDLSNAILFDWYIVLWGGVVPLPPDEIDEGAEREGCFAAAWEYNREDIDGAVGSAKRGKGDALPQVYRHKRERFGKVDGARHGAFDDRGCDLLSAEDGIIESERSGNDRSVCDVANKGKLETVCSS